MAGTRAFRRIGTGPLQDLGVAGPYTRSYATAAGNDGDTVIGTMDFGVTSSFSEAFRWTEDGGMQLLGFTRPGDRTSRALGISRDSQTVVGVSVSPAGTRQAFRWTAGGGMSVLPDAPGSSAGSVALASNFDGTVIGGTSGLISRAAVWRGNGVEVLGLPGGFSHQSAAWCVSDSGNLIGGSVSQNADNVAAVWTSAGAFMLSSYLTTNGVTGHETGRCSKSGVSRLMV